METVFKPKFKFGRIKSKHLILEIFSQCHSREDITGLFWEMSKQFRVLVIENYALIQTNEYLDKIMLDLVINWIQDLTNPQVIKAFAPIRMNATKCAPEVFKLIACFIRPHHNLEELRISEWDTANEGYIREIAPKVLKVQRANITGIRQE